jgi:hypothetical protein
MGWHRKMKLLRVHVLTGEEFGVCVCVCVCGGGIVLQRWCCLSNCGPPVYVARNVSTIALCPKAPNGSRLLPVQASSSAQTPAHPDSKRSALSRWFDYSAGLRCSEQPFSHNRFATRFKCVSAFDIFKSPRPYMLSKKDRGACEVWNRVWLPNPPFSCTSACPNRGVPPHVAPAASAPT